MKRCRFPHGITIKPDGVNELLSCVMEEKKLRYRGTGRKTPRMRSSASLALSRRMTDMEEDK